MKRGRSGVSYLHSTNRGSATPVDVPGAGVPGTASGKVFLVGAGPGDAELITVKGLRCIQTAQVLVYDRLVCNELVNSVRDNCERVYVGKRKHLHAMSQPDINGLLIHHARLGRRVVRLKGGDPFVFGRGGEEVDALDKADIAWEVIPGVTAAAGAAASTGTPLTHRAESQAVTLVTAYRQTGDNRGQLSVDWDLVMHGGQTVVFYMGLSCMNDIIGELLARGKSPDTPFTVISRATQPGEVCISGTIATILELCAPVQMASPAILVMGPRPRGEGVGALVRGALDPELSGLKSVQQQA